MERSRHAPVNGRTAPVGATQDLAARGAPTARDWIDVHLLGRLRVERAGLPLPALTCRKAQELLAYLLLHRDHAHRRETLADRLWGENGSTEPRKALRQALWHLQSALGTEPPLIESLGGDWIRVDTSAHLRLDLADFELAWSELEDAEGRELPPRDLSRARRALDLYRGELLEESGWEWCLSERVRLHDKYLSLADRVMSSYLVAEPASGVRLGHEILRHDGAREKTHQQLMRLHLLVGDRSAALRQYERCVVALREELGVGPCRSTRELLAGIRDDRLRPDGTAQAPLAGVVNPPAELGALDWLRQLRAVLSEARHEVHEEIQARERSLAAAGQR